MKGGKTGASIALVWIALIMPWQFVLAQVNIPLGTWRTHFQYQDVRKVVLAQSRVYVATANTLFYLDETDNSVNKLTQIDGLSEVGIASLFFDTERQTLIIGYQNGTIDFLQNNEIRPFLAIAQTPQLQDKNITSLAVYDGYCYAGTPAGVVVVDISETEIVESYTEIGPNADPVAVNDIEIINSTIYLATNLGLLTAPLNEGLNLQDFNNWSIAIPPGNFPFLSQLAWKNGQLYAAHRNRIFTYNGDVWADLSSALGGDVIVSMDAQQDLLITLNGNVSSRVVNDAFQDVYVTDQLLRTSTGVPGSLFIGSTNEGLLQGSVGQLFPTVLAGPPTDQIAEISILGDEVYVLPETVSLFDKQFAEPGNYGVFSEGTWTIESTPQVNNLSAVAQANGKIYFSSVGDGLLDMTSNILYDHKNAAHPLTAESFSDSLIIVPSIATGAENELWVLNKDADRGLHRLGADGVWESFSLGFGQGARFPEKLSVSTRTGIVWVASDPQVSGLYLYNPQEDISLNLSNAGGLPSSRINDLVIDREDEVWVATNRGIAFFQSSDSPFFDGFDDAIVPVIDGSFLLDNEPVSAIAVDGGNRKWVGTYDGIWLIEESGDEVVQRFTTQNSPLPSDSIVSIDINPVSGEVFIATSRGLISYRSDATAAGRQFGTVKVFPNPVPPGFRGLIGISGLAQDVNVKITDIDGNLIKEMFANGGTAMWDGRDNYGQSVNTGIYLVFAGNSDGSETFVGKFAVVR